MSVNLAGWIRRGLREKKNREIKVNWASSSPATSTFEFNEYNLLPSGVKFQFLSWTKFKLQTLQFLTALRGERWNFRFCGFGYILRSFFLFLGGKRIRVLGFGVHCGLLIFDFWHLFSVFPICVPVSLRSERQFYAPQLISNGREMLEVVAWEECISTCHHCIRPDGLEF